MDALKKIRAGHRSVFTKINDSLLVALEKSSEESVLQGLLATLEGKIETLKELDLKILTNLIEENCSQEVCNEEIESQDKYIGLLNKSRALVNRIIKSEVCSVKSCVSSSNKTTPRLPKIELKKFSGELLDWIPFWNLFERIHSNTELDDLDKFHYLLQSMVPNSKAEKLISSYPPTASNYSKAVNSLKARFGREDLLIEVYVRELLNLVLCNLQNKTDNLSQMYDKLETQLRALESLGVESDACSAMLYPLVESCLPQDVLRAWNRSSLFDSESVLKTKLSELMKFLKREVQNEQRISIAAASFQNTSTKNKIKDRSFKAEVLKPTGSNLLAHKFTPQNSQCVFCKSSSHFGAECSQAESLTLDERKVILRKNGCCFICLKMGHIGKNCRVFVKCNACSRRHCTIMCPGKVEETITEKAKPVESALSNLSTNQVFLQTLIVFLRNDEFEHKVRVLIDTGSQKSYITKEAAKRMNYQAIGSEKIIHALFGGSQTDVVEHYKFRIRLCDVKRKYFCNLEALDQPVICSNVISSFRGPWDQELSKLGISITDQTCDKIDVLLGADVAGKLFTGKKHNLRCGLVAMETLLGWVLMGKIASEQDYRSNNMLVTSLLNKDMCITQLWELDVLGIMDPGEKKSRQEIEAETRHHFLNTVYRDVNGRYVVSLPWVEGHAPLPSYYELAKRRLERVVVKLKKEGLYEKYDAVFHDWLCNGIIEVVKEEEMDRPAHYLPHRHVVKKNSLTNPLRPVFDAGASEKGSPSLIPRLELLAAVIGVRLMMSLKNSFEYGGLKEFYWTDSTTLLGCIRRDEIWTPFVGNRVREIRKLSEVERWFYVPGSINPADLPSRGCSPQHLADSRWWEGPEWLLESDENWPNQDLGYDEESIEQEKRKKVVSALAATPDTGWYYRRFSNFPNILRLIGWIKRFISNCRKRLDDRAYGPLTASEIIQAELTLWKLIQAEAFEKDYKKLVSLCPIRDEEGLIRLETKVSNRKDKYDFRYPIVLPSRHPVVWSMLYDLHLKNCHVGAQGLLSLAREKYWILSGRRTTRSVVKKCVRCRRHDAKPAEPPPIALPERRVRDANTFEITGIDLTGPLILRSGEKAWICLFTCAVYRAVHLELLNSLSTENFLRGFRRFISRRGRPHTVWTDNGTNFKGAESALKDVDWNEIINYSAVRQIHWQFNPPSAPWWGGWWERLIGLLKNLLRRTLGRASLGYEEMYTVLCDCESVINNRPLTYLAGEPSDMTPLTPAYFLRDNLEVGVPDLDAIDQVSLNRRWRRLQELRKTFRTRFRLEYLGQLELYSKRNIRELKTGQLVLIKYDNFKRLEWHLGVIKELIKGKDGVPRVARVTTARGLIVRPLQRLYPLELQEDDPELGDNRKQKLYDEGQKEDCMPAEPDAKALKTENKVTRSGRIIVKLRRFIQ